jgi:streptogramin lyase
MRLAVLRSSAALAFAAMVPAACASSSGGPFSPGASAPMVQAADAPAADAPAPDAPAPGAVKVTMFNMPMTQTDPFDIALGANGYLYATQPQGTPNAYLWQVSEIGHITKIKPALGYAGAAGITGANGVVYFGVPHSGGPVLYAFAKGKFKVLGSAAVNAIYYLKRAKDGSVWFSDPGGYQVGHIVKGKATLYRAPTKYCSPYGITIGSDQNVWVAEQCATTTGRIGRITATGSWNEFSLRTKNEEPTLGDGITAGSDGNLWYTIGANRIGRITTAGKITEFSISPADGAGYAITAGSDKALWYTLQQTGKIGRITTKGVATSYAVPGNNLQLAGISQGAAKTIWFTNVIGNQIGRLTY